MKSFIFDDIVYTEYNPNFDDFETLVNNCNEHKLVI